MARDIKKDIKNAAVNAESKLTEALLRWKYDSEGAKVPDKEKLERQSRLIADQANKILSKSGKKLWNDLKAAYGNKEGRKGKDR